jgi:hypothetical protein
MKYFKKAFLKIILGISIFLKVLIMRIIKSNKLSKETKKDYLNRWTSLSNLESYLYKNLVPIPKGLFIYIYLYDDKTLNKVEEHSRNIDEQERLSKSVKKILNEMKIDFLTNPYIDKIQNFKKGNGIINIEYIFEDGRKVYLSTPVTVNNIDSFHIKFDNISVDVTSNNLLMKVISILDDIIQYQRTRPGDVQIKSDKISKYNLLKKTLENYNLQLEREKKEGGNTVQTINEIENIKDKIKKFEEKYKI